MGDGGSLPVAVMRTLLLWVVVDRVPARDDAPEGGGEGEDGADDWPASVEITGELGVGNDEA